MLEKREKDKVCIQAVYDLMILKKEVYPQDIDAQSENVYLSIKAIGKETIVKYVDHNGKEVNKKINELSNPLLAWILFTPIRIYRWNPQSIERVSKHCGVDINIIETLYTIGVLERNGMNDIISTQTLIDRFLKFSKVKK